MLPQKMTAILIAAFIYVVAAGQTIDSTLQRYSEQFSQERVYFHFDKSAYFPGDTVWFKAYLTSGWQAPGVSKNLYTEWFDASGNVLQHGALPVVLSSAYGQAVIPTGYTGNVLHLHAYTGWMLNFDSAFLYDKEIPVIQAQAATGKAVNPPHSVHVTLFPEGGNLVQNLISAVAFKAENQSGRPVDITGAIKNKNGEVLDSLSVLHDGMGRFFITPVPGDVYTVSWKDEDGDAGQVVLPAALPAGATLKVSPLAGRVSWHVERSEAAPDDLKTLHLVATIKEAEVYNSTINLAQVASATNYIPSSRLPSGILQVTLFNAAWQPLAERIVFVNNNDYAFETTIAAKGNTRKRGRNEIEVDVPDSIQGNLSIAVTDGGLLNDNSNSIITHLLLTADLRGRVNNPAYYFSNRGDSVKQALDLVMLTNGWRRYNWDEIVAGRLPAIKYAKDTGHVAIKGQARMKNGAALPPGGLLSLNIRSSNADDSLSTVVIKELGTDGSFNVDPGPFHDTLRITYNLQGDKKLARRAWVSFTNSLVENEVYHRGYRAFYTPLEDSLAVLQSQQLREKDQALMRIMQTTTLKAVTVKTKVKTREQLLDDAYASPVFQGYVNATTMDVANDPSAKGLYSLANYLQDKIPSFDIKTSPGLPPTDQFYYRERVTLTGGLVGRVSVYLDELQTDEETVEAVPLDQIAYIKFFKSGMLSTANDQPTLAIYTRQGGDNDTSSSVKHAMVKGYLPTKEFYNPDYSKQATTQDIDIRSTLYWNPYIITNAAKHKIKIVFYNNDVSKSLRVVLEGMSSDGKLTRAEKLVE